MRSGTGSLERNALSRAAAQGDWPASGLAGEALRGEGSRGDRLALEVAGRAVALDEDRLAPLEPILRADVQSEFDARHLAVYLRDVGRDWSREFHAVLDRWEEDEALHYGFFERAYVAAFPGRAEELAADLSARAANADFAPLEHLFRGEFEAACLFAYDELSTVAAYRALRPNYGRLGPQLVELVDIVTADEGRHHLNFVALIRELHRGRMPGAGDVLEAIRATEGVEYANTFVLDHDDDVWSEEIFDRAHAILLRRLTGSRSSA